MKFIRSTPPPQGWRSTAFTQWWHNDDREMTVATDRSPFLTLTHPSCQSRYILESYLLSGLNSFISTDKLLVAAAASFTSQVKPRSLLSPIPDKEKAWSENKRYTQVTHTYIINLDRTNILYVWNMEIDLFDNKRYINGHNFTSYYQVIHQVRHFCQVKWIAITWCSAATSATFGSLIISISQLQRKAVTLITTSTLISSVNKRTADGYKVMIALQWNRAVAEKEPLLMKILGKLQEITALARKKIQRNES